MKERTQSVQLNLGAADGSVADAGFRHEGGRRQAVGVQFPLTQETLRQWTEKQERMLRLQFDSRQLDPEHEEVLATLSVDNPTTLWQRYKYLVGLRFVVDQQYQRRGESSEEAMQASLQLRRRDPVRVVVAGRRIGVTGRSRAAMIGLARHELARRALTADLDRIAELAAETETELAGRWRGRGRLRRRLRHLAELHRRVYFALQLHSRWIYAHALTSDGRPARSAGDAPGWWDEITQQDEKALLLALWEAGPGRYHRMGPEPRDPDASKWERAEEFGFDTLLASFERDRGLTPAEADDIDLAQLLAHLRNGAHPKLKTEAA